MWSWILTDTTGCNLLPIMELRCASTDTPDRTRVAGIEIGRPFVQHLNGWPLDFVGYFGLLRHDERGLQPDSWQFNAYVKGYWYGFPWDDRVRTRVGFGVGLSYAQRIPYVEARDQAIIGAKIHAVLRPNRDRILRCLRQLIARKVPGDTPAWSIAIAPRKSQAADAIIDFRDTVAGKRGSSTWGGIASMAHTCCTLTISRLARKYGISTNTPCGVAGPPRL